MIDIPSKKLITSILKPQSLGSIKEFGIKFVLGPKIQGKGHLLFSVFIALTIPECGYVSKHDGQLKIYQYKKDQLLDKVPLSKVRGIEDRRC